jgi:uncharacterized protein YbjT (DUF2867 family)
VKLLVIGGTVFLGRHLVEAALQAGHEITLFTRGEHNPDLFLRQRSCEATGTAIWAPWRDVGGTQRSTPAAISRE